MPAELVFAPEVEQDLTEAYDWYERQRPGLVRRFPFSVFHEYSGETVTVYSVFHNSRDPEKWRQRLA